MGPHPIKLIVIVISDRASKGIRPDKTLPLLKQWCKDKPFQIIKKFIIADNSEAIEDVLIDSINNETAQLIITSGGTGCSARDITPEVTRRIIEKPTPGIDEFLRSRGIKITPFAALSRGISGIAKNKLVINLPGNPDAVVENMQWLNEILPHAIALLNPSTSEQENHTYKKKSK